MEWLNNPWVIGIGTSIISGLLVFFITRKFFTEKQKREYNQKIKTANNEILYAIRPMIVEQTKPNKEIINSVFYSTARKYGVELCDIYDIETLCDDLINEIMSNSFLSSEQKMDLTKMITDLKKEGEKNEIKEKIITIYRDSKKNSSTYTAMLMSLTTAFTALFLTFYFFTVKNGDLFNSSNGEFPEFFRIFMVALLIPTMSLMMTTLLKYIKDKEKDKEATSTDKTKQDEPKNEMEKTPPNKKI